VRGASNYSTGAFLANGAGCTNDLGIPANSEFIGGSAMTTIDDDVQLGGGVGGGATPRATSGLCRIVATTDQHTFAVQVIFADTLTTAGTYSGIMPHVAFHLRYPACPISRIVDLS